MCFQSLIPFHFQIDTNTLVEGHSCLPQKKMCMYQDFVKEATLNGQLLTGEFEMGIYTPPETHAT
ncbi:hypothetical protein FACHB389_03230 [Nostoc calcicola FACHB-389]|nr:hypothetical protein FACHB389_03230 [Nostoc calcicola FACHB-389]